MGSATSKIGGQNAHGRGFYSSDLGRGGWIPTWLVACAGLCLGSMVAGWAVQSEFSGPAQKAYEEAQVHYKKEPHNPEAVCQFGRAIFDLAEFATNNTERAQMAEHGISISREAVALATNSGAAHYYLAMNIGQLARTKSLGALKLIGQMEREFKAARDLDPHIDYAGPDRNLGVLYRDAPSIGSVGSRSKARECLQQAVKLAPEYPENHLNLLEAYLKWGERGNAENELKALEGILPAARARFAGPVWASSWADWNPRIEKAEKKLHPSAAPLESPRGKS